MTRSLLAAWAGGGGINESSPINELYPALNDNLGWDSLLSSVFCPQGDSGGPLACTTESGKIWYQVGITSWGRSCGQNTPGIYTLLENFSLWIKKVTELEGRPFNAEKTRAPTNQKPLCPLASGFPGPGSPRLWLLLCLLASLLF